MASRKENTTMSELEIQSMMMKYRDTVALPFLDNRTSIGSKCFKASDHKKWTVRDYLKDTQLKAGCGAIIIAFESYHCLAKALSEKVMYQHVWMSKEDIISNKIPWKDTILQAIQDCDYKKDIVITTGVQYGSDILTLTNRMVNIFD